MENARVLNAANTAVVDSLYLTWASRVFPLDPSANTVKPRTIATLIANLGSLGFVPSRELIQNWLSASDDVLKAKGKVLLRNLRKSVGAHVVHAPMYPNFPAQVMEASDAELFLNAVMHYTGDMIGVRIMPFYTKHARLPLGQDEGNLRLLELGSYDHFIERTSALMGSSAALNQQKVDELRQLASAAPDAFSSALQACSFLANRENIASLCAIAYQELDNTVVPAFSELKSSTDALRLAVALCGGDVSLASATRFKKLSKSTRRLILSILDKSSANVEDMLARSEQFKRLGENLHAGQYASRYPNAYEKFNALRNPENYPELTRSFASKVEDALAKADVINSVDLLEHRPGYFARRLNELLSKASVLNDPELTQQYVTDAFAAVCAKVSTTVLLQVKAYFTHRAQVSTDAVRLFIPKGMIAKARTISDERVPLSKDVCERVVAICDSALSERFAASESLGKVYLDKELKNYKVPFGVRSASDGLRTVGRGSRLAIDPAKALRFFIWWKEGSRRTDLDLSAVGLDENFALKSQITYYNLRGSLGVHSGDITSAPQGASEYIDINREAALASGIRYVVMTVHVYAGDTFDDLPECFAGFMGRKDLASGEVYEPKTVDQKVDLTSDARAVIPFVFDLVDNVAIWFDMSVGSYAAWANNVANTSHGISAVARGVVTSNAANLYDLFSLHACARGEVVSSREEADIVFAVDGDVTPFDTVDILNTWLS